MTKNINWGIIGVGKIAEKFATDLKAVKNAQLHAVASSSSLERAKDFAERYEAPYFYDSYESIFQTPDLDAHLHRHATYLARRKCYFMLKK
jgi:predicted dehydrogenase